MSRDFDGVRVGIYSVSRLCPEDNVSGLSVDSVSELRLGDSVSELRSGDNTSELCSGDSVSRLCRNIVSRDYVRRIMSRDYVRRIMSRDYKTLTNRYILGYVTRYILRNLNLS